LRILILEDSDADAELVGKGLQRIQKPFSVEGLAKKVKDVLKKMQLDQNFFKNLTINTNYKQVN